jgi:hypothetical protein
MQWRRQATGNRRLIGQNVIVEAKHIHEVRVPGIKVGLASKRFPPRAHRICCLLRRVGSQQKKKKTGGNLRIENGKSVDLLHLDCSSVDKIILVEIQTV